MSAIIHNEFEWIVLKAGYQCEAALKAHISNKSPTPDKYLCEVTPYREQKVAKHYYPLRDYPALFMEFARLNADELSIVSFANQYGFLGIDEAFVIPNNTKHKSTGRTYKAESIDSWKREIRELQMVVTRWEQFKARDYKSLSQLVRDSEKVEKLIESLPIVERNRTFYQELIIPNVNENLEKHATFPQLIWDVGQKIPQPAIIIQPTNLINALWLQFAEAIHQNASIKTCIQCGKAIIMHPTTNRKTKKYCSDACRVKSYRAKKKR